MRYLLILCVVFSGFAQWSNDTLGLVPTIGQEAIWGGLCRYGDSPDLLLADSLLSVKTVEYTDGVIDTTEILHVRRIAEKTSDKHGVIAVIYRFWPPFKWDRPDSVKVWVRSDWPDTVRIIEERIAR